MEKLPTSAKERPTEEPPAKEPPARNPSGDDTCTGGASAGGEGPASGTRYPVLSRLPEVPGLLADTIAELPSKAVGLEAPETGLFFREREDGTVEFYPWRFGPGYLLADPDRQRRLRRSFRRFWGAAGLLLLVLEIALQGALQGAFSLGPERVSGEFERLAVGVGEELALAGGLGILALAAYSALACSWVSGQPQAGRRGVFEELRRGAEANSTADLGFGAALGLGLVLLGGAMVWKGAALVGVSYAGVGAVALTSGYRLWWRWKHRGSGAGPGR